MKQWRNGDCFKVEHPLLEEDHYGISFKDEAGFSMDFTVFPTLLGKYAIRKEILLEKPMKPPKYSIPEDFIFE